VTSPISGALSFCETAIAGAVYLDILRNYIFTQPEEEETFSENMMVHGFLF
jgi:hypothetical protein